MSSDGITLQKENLWSLLAPVAAKKLRGDLWPVVSGLEAKIYLGLSLINGPLTYDEKLAVLKHGDARICGQCGKAHVERKDPNVFPGSEHIERGTGFWWKSHGSRLGFLNWSERGEEAHMRLRLQLTQESLVSAPKNLRNSFPTRDEVIRGIASEISNRGHRAYDEADAKVAGQFLKAIQGLGLGPPLPRLKFLIRHAEKLASPEMVGLLSMDGKRGASVSRRLGENWIRRGWWSLPVKCLHDEYENLFGAVRFDTLKRARRG